MKPDWGHLTQRYAAQRPRKLLALDGGGIRGVLTLSILKAIEQKVGQKLCYYFDYIAGTSTGAIIAVGLAKGVSVDELVSLYRLNGTGMFRRTRFLERLNSPYQNGPLAQKLKEVFGETTNLRPEHLETLLLVVTRNVSTDSPWPISSNPDARYNVPSSQWNLEIPLWKLVRARKITCERTRQKTARRAKPALAAISSSHPTPFDWARPMIGWSGILL